MLNKSIGDDTEQACILLLQQGSQKAFGKFYDKYAPMLMGLILRLVEDKKMADDILQMVFNKIWENRAKLDFLQEPLFSKLLKIARDTARDVMPVGRPNPFTGVQPPGEIKYCPGAVDVLDHQNITAHSGLLFELDKTSKEALDLIYFKGYNFADAAAVLGLPSNMVIEKVKMAIKQLKMASL